jgi:hypothetical protein
VALRATLLFSAVVSTPPLPPQVPTQPSAVTASPQPSAGPASSSTTSSPRPERATGATRERPLGEHLGELARDPRGRIALPLSALAGLAWGYMRLNGGRKAPFLHLSCAFIAIMLTMDIVFFADVLPADLPFPYAHMYSLAETLGLISIFILYALCLL